MYRVSHKRQEKATTSVFFGHRKKTIGFCLALREDHVVTDITWICFTYKVTDLHITWENEFTIKKLDQNIIKKCLHLSACKIIQRPLDNKCDSISRINY